MVLSDIDIRAEIGARRLIFDHTILPNPADGVCEEQPSALPAQRGALPE